MANDSKGVQREAWLRSGLASTVRELLPQGPDFLDAIGYEAADPALQALQWFEAMQGQSTPVDRP